MISISKVKEQIIEVKKVWRPATTNPPNPTPDSSPIEERLETVFNSVLCGIMIVDAKTHTIHDVNLHAAKIIGAAREEIIGKECHRSICPTERGHCPFIDLKKSVDNAEGVLLNASGERISVVKNVVPLTINGRGYLLEAFLDITGHKRAGEALRESEEKFAKAFRFSPDAIAITTLKDGKFIEVNDSYTRITGYSREEVIGHTATELDVWAKAEDRARMVQMLKEQGRVSNEEFNIRLSSGEIHTWLFSAEPTNVGGEPCLISIASDITARKQAEDRLGHLNSVLLAIRNVNQLITKEKDRNRLLKGVCDELIETRGYYNVWISLLDDSQKFISAVESGLGKDFLPLEKRFKQGELSKCARTALMQPGVVITEDPSKNCGDCPLAKVYRGRGILTIRMEHDGRVYGLLTASVPNVFVRDKEEQMLFKEVAMDIAFALHDIEVVEEHRRAEEALRESEEKFAKSFRSSPDAIAITTIEDGRFVEVNDGYTRITGYTRDQVIGHTSAEFSAWAQAGTRDQIKQVLKEQGRISNKEVHMYTNSDDERTCLFSAEAINIGGEPCLISIVTDITERKRAEEAMANEAVRRRILIEQSSDGIVILDQNGNVYEANRRFAEMLGYSPEEVLQLHVWDWDTQWTQEQLLEMIRSVSTEGDRFETYHQRKDGTICDVEISTNGATFAGQKLVFCVCREITERKQAEEALRESEEFGTSVLENAPNPITVINPDTSVKYVNPAFEKLTGFSLEELVGLRAPYPWWPEDRREVRLSGLTEFMAGGDRITEQTIQNKNGETFLIEINMVRVMHDGTFKYYLAHWNDVTEQRKGEEALKESEKKYRDLLDNTSDLIQSVTPDGHFRYVNNGWKQALGYDDAETSKLSVFDILHPDSVKHYKMLFQKMKSGEDIGRVNTTFIGKDRNKIIVEGNVTGKYLNGELVYTRGIFRDITKNKYLEEQMFRLSSAVSMTTDCVIITDFDAKIIDVNHKMLEMYGADSKEELIGRHFLEVIVPSERVTVNMDVREIIEKGSLECREYNMLSKQGHEFRLQMSTSLVRNADGKPMGMVRVGREPDKPV